MRPGKNLEMLSVVARALAGLKDSVVFVGGAAVTVYIDDAAAPQLRVTDDVDCVAEIAGWKGYHALEKELQKLGFKHPLDETDPPRCRWKLGGMKVDVMAACEEVLGFGNRWYGRGMETSATVALPGGPKIRVFTAPFFLASKVEAFLGRGKGDYQASPDLEDIIAVLDGRKSIRSDLDKAPDDVKDFLRTEFRRLLQNRDFVDSIQGHLGRTDKVISLLKGFTGLKA